jgi:hypothetical protein
MSLGERLNIFRYTVIICDVFNRLSLQLIENIFQLPTTFNINRYGNERLRMWYNDFYIVNIVAYLLHARTVGPQKQPFLNNTRMQQWNNGVINPLLGTGRRNDVIPQQCLAVTWVVFSAMSMPRVYSTSLLAAKRRVLVEFWGSRVTEQEMARRLHSDLKC